jgi:MFS family permease
MVVSGLSNIGPAPLVLLAAGLPIGAWAFSRLTPPGTLRARPVLPAAILLRGFLTFAFFCSDAYVPLAIQSWRGYPAVVSGLVLTAATLAWTGGSWILAQRIHRFGPFRFLRVGFVVLVVGTLGFLTILIPTVPIIVAVVMWSIAGLAMGLSYSTPSLVTLAEALPEEQGSATAALQLSDVLGTSLGTGLGGALVVAGSPPGGVDWPGLAAAFAVSAVVAVAGLLLTARFRGAHRPATTRAEAPAAG